MALSRPPFFSFICTIVFSVTRPHASSWCAASICRFGTSRGTPSKSWTVLVSCCLRVVAFDGGGLGRSVRRLATLTPLSATRRRSFRGQLDGCKEGGNKHNVCNTGLVVCARSAMGLGLARVALAGLGFCEVASYAPVRDATPRRLAPCLHCICLLACCYCNVLSHPGR
jgi:hypothetical protein